MSPAMGGFLSIGFCRCWVQTSLEIRAIAAGMCARLYGSRDIGLRRLAWLWLPSVMLLIEESVQM